MALFQKLKNFFVDYDYYKQITSNTREIKIYYKKHKNLIFSSDSFTRLISRSIIQYKLQSKSRNILKLFISELICLIIFFPLLIYIILLKNEKTKKAIKINNIFINENNINYNLPDKFKKNYIIKKIKYSLNFTDLKLIILIINFYIKNFGIFLIFQFLIKILLKLAEINYLSKKYNFSNLILIKEYDFSLSFITFLCRKKKIKVNIIQHGDVYISTQTCFFEIDEYYSWDKKFKEILKKNNVFTEKFKIFNPSKKLLKSKNIKKNICMLIPSKIHYSNSQQMLIKNLNEIIYELKKIENLGYKVSVKPHPRIDQTYEIDLFKKNKIKILNKRTDINLISDKNHYVISSLSSALFYFLKKKKNLLILNTKFIKPIKSYYPIFKYKKTKIIKKNKIYKCIK